MKHTRMWQFVSSQMVNERGWRASRSFALSLKMMLGAMLLSPLTGFSGVEPFSPAYAATALDAKLDSADQKSMPISFASIVRKVRPAVVSIQISVNSSGALDSLADMPRDHPFNDFFRRFFGDELPNGLRQHKRRKRFGRAQGSGFVISADGYVVTNHHVIDGAVDVRVVMDDGTKYDARVIGADPKMDLALLKVDAKKELPHVVFADDDVEIGDWVVAVGNPFGLGGSVTAGIVSARGRNIGAGPYDDFIQIDAPINRGNSGGPAFNLQGEVIGVNTAIFSPSGGSVGIAFAIPSSAATDIIAQLKTHGSVKRGWLGVQVQPITDDVAESLGLDEAKGALIADLTEDGPAGKAGFKDGDVILKVNGDVIEDARDLARKIAAIPPGSKVDLSVWRDGRVRIIGLKLGSMAASEKLNSNGERSSSSSSSEELVLSNLGLTLAKGDSVRSDGNEPEGVVIVDIEDGSVADEKGLRIGDVITAVGSASVSDPEDVMKGVEDALKNGRKAVLLRIQSGQRRRFVALTIEKI